MSIRKEEEVRVRVAALLDQHFPCWDPTRIRWVCQGDQCNWSSSGYVKKWHDHVSEVLAAAGLLISQIRRCHHSRREADGPVECGRPLPCAEHYCARPMTGYSHALTVVFQALPERGDYKGNYNEARTIVDSLYLNGLLVSAVVPDKSGQCSCGCGAPTGDS